MPAYALFPTALGRCALAWGPRGLVGVGLPDAGDDPLGGILRQHPDAVEAEPPPPVAAAIAAIQAALDGEARDLGEILLDFDGLPPFHRRVYEAARAIPPGRTLTYGELARRLGDPGAARAVGQALGANPFPVVVPCHRVLAAQGGTGGFSAPGGVDTKLRLLAREGVLGDGRLALFKGA